MKQQASLLAAIALTTVLTVLAAPARSANGDVANALMRLGQGLQQMSRDQQQQEAAREARAAAEARAQAIRDAPASSSLNPIGRPNLSAMPCRQRVEALLDFWAAEERKPKSPCDRALEKVAAQRDLNDTALACPNDLTTVPSMLTEYENTQRMLCSGGASAPTAGNRCPQNIAVGGKSVSVIEPIHAHGSAQRALDVAREQLGSITAQGSCKNMLNSTECELHKDYWSTMVSALQCHATAVAVR